MSQLFLKKGTKLVKMSFYMCNTAFSKAKDFIKKHIK